MEQRDQQELWNGFGRTFSRAFELVLTPVLFGLGGAGLDRVLGTSPVFMILLGLLAVIGLAARAYYAYAVEMHVHERRLPGRSGGLS